MACTPSGDEIQDPTMIQVGDLRYLRRAGGLPPQRPLRGISHEQDPAYAFQDEPGTGLRQDPDTGTVYWRRNGVDIYNMDEGGGGSLAATDPLDLTASVLTLAGLSSLGTALYYTRTNAAGTAWEYRSPAQTLGDIGAAAAAHTHLLADVTDVTATAAEVNILDGATLTTTELNYVDGVTSAIQTQLDGKQPLDATLTALAGLATGADKVPYSTGTDTFAQTDLSAFGRSLLDDANAGAARNTLGASSGIWPLAVGGTGADLSATGGTSQFLRQSSAGAAITVSVIGHADLGSGGGSGTKYLRDDMTWQTVSAGVTDHGALTGLSDDDHAQYALLTGRSGGQTLIGGTAASGTLTLQSTAHATKGTIFFGASSGYDEVNTRLGIGTASPSYALDIVGTIAGRDATQTYLTRIITSSSGSQILNNEASNRVDIGTGLALYSAGAVGERLAGGLIQGITAVTGPVTLATQLSYGTAAICYGNSSTYLSAIEITATGSGYGNLKLMKSGGVVGIGMGSSTPARALEVRSTSAQQRWSYDGTYSWDLQVTATSDLKITGVRYSGDLNSIAIGAGAVATSNNACLAIGQLASCTSTYGIAIGYNANASDGGIAIGRNSSATSSGTASFGGTCAGNAGTAIGVSSSVGAGHTGSVALGYSATVTAANQFVCGSGNNYFISNVYFGKGVTHATPTAWTLNGTGGSGTDIAGGDLCLGGGRPTGAGAGGSVKLQAASAGASGTTLRNLATVLEVATGNKIGFYGVTPVARAAAYTQTYSTADRTLGAYTADSESVAYTGIDNAQGGTPYAQLTDLNALRTAYENLRAFVEDLAQHHNSVLDDLQAVGLLQ